MTIRIGRKKEKFDSYEEYKKYYKFYKGDRGRNRETLYRVKNLIKDYYNSCNDLDKLYDYLVKGKRQTNILTEFSIPLVTGFFSGIMIELLKQIESNYDGNIANIAKQNSQFIIKIFEYGITAGIYLFIIILIVSALVFFNFLYFHYSKKPYYTIVAPYEVEIIEDRIKELETVKSSVTHKLPTLKHKIYKVNVQRVKAKVTNIIKIKSNNVGIHF